MALTVVNKPFTVLLCYRRPDNPVITSKEWEQFFGLFKDDYLVTGDFNAHHPKWGDLRSNCRHGGEWNTALEKVGAAVLNDGSDHYPIYISLNCKVDCLQRTVAPSRLYNRKTDC